MGNNLVGQVNDAMEKYRPDKTVIKIWNKGKLCVILAAKNPAEWEMEMGLDLNSGDSKRTTYYAKIQESTHIFIADYVTLDERINAENARMIIGGKLYDIMLIDNPMGMGKGSQLEIYLKYTGGQ